MQVIVQKYGGTSVNSEEKRLHIIQNAKEVINEGFCPVIVVSAMGRFPAPYATDSLLSLVSNENDNRRNKDMLISCGEIISAVVISDILCSNGVKALPLSGAQAGLITDDNYGEADIIEFKTDYITSLIKKGIVPVVAGFQGITKDGNITTLGRGGSDTTATALGAALKAHSVEIYTDVDGIMQADPNIVEDAKIFSKIRYEDIYLMASSGAKVIHPRAIEYAQNANIDVSILNADKPRSYSHTVITGDINHEENKMFSAVTSLSARTQVNTECESVGIQNKMLTEIANCGISIDMINIFNNKSVFIIDEGKTAQLKDKLDELNINYSVKSGFSKISSLSDKIHGIPGVMAKMINILYENDIEVYQSSDSNRSIALLVREEDAKNAVNLLYKLMNE